MGREETGRMLAELHRRGRLSWPVIARQTGLRKSTAYHLAQPYRTTDDVMEPPPADRTRTEAPGNSGPPDTPRSSP